MPIFDALYRERCPSCNHEYHPSECAIISTIFFENNKPKVLRRAPQTRLEKLIALTRPEDYDLSGRYYVLNGACYACPHCEKPLPLGDNENLTIAVIGDTSSGKSHYICALIHQLQQEYRPQEKGVGVKVMGANQEMEERYYGNYFKTMFIERTAIDITPPAVAPGVKVQLDKPPDLKQDPLIYRLTLDIPPRPQRRITLSIYDVSGEDLTNQTRLVQFNPQILNADAIIYLADPRNLPYYPYLHTSQQGQGIVRHPPSYGLKWVMDTFLRYQQVDRLRIPVAITLSKSDLLKYNRPNHHPYTFNTNPAYRSLINLQDLIKVDAEVRQVIAETGDEPLLRAGIASSMMVGFFAVSATGSTLDMSLTPPQFPKVEPCRCLDPLLWILWQKRLLI